MTEIITFDALFELVRNEKSKEEIIKVNPNIYEQISNYLKSKLELYKNFKSNQAEAEKIKTQINNARKVIKEWYERRERKILLLAITKSRFKNVDESNLLSNEILMLNQITEILDKHKENVLLNLINLKLPNIENLQKIIIFDNNNNSKININRETNIVNEALDKKKLDNEFENNKKIKSQDINNYEKDKENQIHEKNTLTKIKILEPIEKFIGTDLKIYGPFKENDIIELPNELAEVILKKNKGQKVE